MYLETIFLEAILIDIWESFLELLPNVERQRQGCQLVSYSSDITKQYL